MAIVVTPVPSRVSSGGSDECPVCVVGDLERSSVSVVYDHHPQVTTTTDFPPLTLPSEILKHLCSLTVYVLGSYRWSTTVSAWHVPFSNSTRRLHPWGNRDFS